MPPDALRTYVFHGLEAMPQTIARLLQGFSNWDARLAPDRFSAREMIAHLADWEEIWFGRLQRTLLEDEPTLPDMDEGAIAIKRDYSSQDPLANLDRFVAGRGRVLELLRPAPIELWSRRAYREGLGWLDLAQLATIILGHDGYHVKQTLDFTRSPSG